MKQRKQYSKEFKQGGRSISDAATSLSIPAWSLSRRVRADKQVGQEAFRGNGNRTARRSLFVLLKRADGRRFVSHALELRHARRSNQNVKGKSAESHPTSVPQTVPNTG